MAGREQNLRKKSPYPYLTQQDGPFVIGNDDAELVREESGREVRVDYNATLLFENGEIIERYRKIHLVPFTEYFPCRNVLPGGI